MDIRDLFSNLHENPEFSGKEKKTTAILKKYLEENTDLVLKDLIWALHPNLLPDYTPTYIIQLN
jgi:hypothetical protein